MRKILGLALGAAVACAATSASAEEVRGTIEKIDPVAKAIIVNGDAYRMPEATTGGVSLDQLKVGDKVEIMYNQEDPTSQEAYPQAMMVKKVEE